MARFGRRKEEAKIEPKVEAKAEPKPQYVEVAVNLELLNNKLNHIISILEDEN